MVTKGCTSGYSTWIQMKKESKDVMAYKNIGRRVIILQKYGYLEEISLKNVENLHGRKDYKITKKGMEQLVSYILKHPEDVEVISEYMDKIGLNKQKLAEILVNNLETSLKSINKFKGTIKEYVKSDTSDLLQYNIVIRNPAQIERLDAYANEFFGWLNDGKHALERQSRQVKPMHVDPISSSSSPSKDQVTNRKTETGHIQKFTSKSVPEHRDPSFEQEEKKLERGLGHPEIADSELEEDLYRMTKPPRQSKTAPTPPPVRSRKKKR